MKSLLKIGKSIVLANEFEEIIARKGLEPISHCGKINSLEEALALLPENNLSIRGNQVHPAIAAALTRELEVEVSLDLVIDRRTKKSFYLFTRGFPGAAISDYYYYYALHPDFYVESNYHTHNQIENKYGKYMPTNGDLTMLKIAYRQQIRFCMYNGSSIEANIYFPDMKRTIYGINPQSGQFYVITPDGTQYEFTPTEWEASFSEAELSDFLHQYPHIEPILASNQKRREDRIVIDIDAISQDKEKLGVQAYKDIILEHGEGFNFNVAKQVCP